MPTYGTDYNLAFTGDQVNTAVGKVVNNELANATHNHASLISDSRCLVGTSLGAAQGLNTGSLLISSTWTDATKVPVNGLYSKGDIKTDSFITLSNAINLAYNATTQCLEFNFL